MSKSGTWATTPNLIGLSFVIQLALILYGDHVDSHPERYGGLKYTDADWRVVSDGAKLIFGVGVAAGDENVKRAEGWLINDTGLPVGDPYERATFRYTPLLPLFLSSSIVHPILGKLTLVSISLLVTPLLLAAGAPTTPTHLLWTLNPFVLNITTRGSPESIIVLFVVILLLCLSNASKTSTATTTATATAVTNDDEAVMWYTFAAFTLGCAISWKIYPVIYVPAIWAMLAKRYGWFGGEVWWFGVVTTATLVMINWTLWSIWGQPFLDHTFLYHLTRLDHRHNFSPYFYPIYQSFFSSPSHLTVGPLSQFMTDNAGLAEILHHPLISFLPQISIVAFAGFTLPQRIGIEGTMFFQTVLFVMFNKVVTSQYFVWFLPLLPSIVPCLDLTPTKAGTLISAWIGAQAIWLGLGYKLEFLGESAHLQVWAAGLVLFGVSCWVVGQLMDHWTPRPSLSARA